MPLPRLLYRGCVLDQQRTAKRPSLPAVWLSPAWVSRFSVPPTGRTGARAPQGPEIVRSGRPALRVLEDLRVFDIWKLHLPKGVRVTP